MDAEQRQKSSVTPQLDFTLVQAGQCYGILACSPEGGPSALGNVEYPPMS